MPDEVLEKVKGLSIEEVWSVLHEKPGFAPADPKRGKPGLHIAPHQLFIDSLKDADVPVVDLFGKIEGGAVVGDNLADAI